ncbi:MAG: hypothetical protein CMG74_07400 [Candidatus Marinimicrobia bacterium]|nr:hypothetical protein [Candidatus Neomarinimicrobiota bacterium]|tara:strand:+ start:9937 stop:11790 length:1854 start_codon:yes stop_codon:yes gene_type:complete
MNICNSILISFFLIISNLYSIEFDERHFPIQDAGRIKPLDTFARNQLLAIYGKRSLKHENLSAIDWIFNLILEPEKMQELTKVFNIRSPEVVASLGLEWTNNDHKYVFNDVFSGLNSQVGLINDIRNKPDEIHINFEKQLLEVYFNASRFNEIAYSLSCLTPSVIINDPFLAEKLNSIPGKRTSYFQLIKYLPSISTMYRNMMEKNEEEWSETENDLINILLQLQNISSKESAQILKIIPPSKLDKTGEWLSPWELMDGESHEPHQDKILFALEKYLAGRYEGDKNAMILAIKEYKKGLLSFPNSKADLNLLEKETWMNEANLFYISVAFYLLSFILLGISWMIIPKWLKIASYGSLLFGLFYHSYGIYLRIIIMSRPPVSTLYETIIFVGFIVVIFSVAIEFLRRDGLGLFIGSVSGTILHYISFGYAADGDTLEILVAVLNSNFWLATHVTTIVIGYGSSLVAGFIGHLYLIAAIRRPENTSLLKSINKNLFGVTLIALFFALFGTILGGIWADQSWGRFWGWDPKENGALMIVLWQLMMIHMRLTGLAKPTGFALGMIMNNIVVAFAWFGVNLLNVGLHSYGFTSGVATNLVIFVIFELIAGFGTYYWAKSRKV